MIVTSVKISKPERENASKLKPLLKCNHKFNYIINALTTCTMVVREGVAVLAKVQVHGALIIHDRDNHKQWLLYVCLSNLPR
jgi:hypothetical protein